MQAKQKVKTHFQLFTEGNTPFSFQPGDILCARFNTSFTKEDSPTSPTLPQQPQQTYTYTEPEHDQLVGLKMNSQNIEERLKKLSANLYQKGVIQSEGLVHTISKQTQMAAKESIRDSLLEDKPRTDMTPSYTNGQRTDRKPVSAIQKLDKENKDIDSSVRAKSSSKKAKLTKEDPFRNNKLKSRFTPRSSMHETVTKSSISAVDPAKSPIRANKTDKKPSVSPKAGLKLDWQTRKGTLPSTSPSRTERIAHKTGGKEDRVPSVSPRAVPKTARDYKENNLRSSFTIQNKQINFKEGDDILVKVKIECYSPFKKGSGGEKSPKSQDELIKTLKMVRKFIDKSIGDDSKLKKLTAMLNQQNPKAS